MPTVHFPRTPPAYTPNDTVAFQVVIDGQLATAEISSEALQDHFGAAGRGGRDLLEAFNAHRAAIEAVGRVKLPGRVSAGRGLLVTADF